jgi:hypothetical protein
VQRLRGSVYIVYTAIGLAAAALYSPTASAARQLIGAHYKTSSTLHVTATTGSTVRIPDKDSRGVAIRPMKANRVIVAMQGCDGCSSLYLDPRTLPQAVGGIPLLAVFPDSASLPSSLLALDVAVDSVPSFLPNAMRVYRPQAVLVDRAGTIHKAAFGPRDIRKLLQELAQ